jgi:predicted ABC-type ATPase
LTSVLKQPLRVPVTLRTIRALRARGYAVDIFFLWVPNVGLALSRVKERVSGGGHNIPDATVERRYTRSIQNLRRYRELADSWMLFDNSGTVPTVIAEENQGRLGIIDQGAYDSLVALYGYK